MRQICQIRALAASARGMPTSCRARKRYKLFRFSALLIGQLGKRIRRKLQDRSRLQRRTCRARIAGIEIGGKRPLNGGFEPADVGCPRANCVRGRPKISRTVVLVDRETAVSSESPGVPSDRWATGWTGTWSGWGGAWRTEPRGPLSNEPVTPPAEPCKAAAYLRSERMD